MNETTRKIKFPLSKFICAFTVIIGLMSFMSFHSSAQSSTTRVLKGQVLEEGTDLPLIGANIWLNETSVGTVTDIDGNFSLNIPAGRSVVLTISYIGYESKEQVVNATDENIKVILSVGSGVLDEIQVIGYGTQRKESVIGSISTIKPSELSAPTGSISTNLAGKLGGVVSVQRTGEPGASSEFWIRGISTFGANKTPLILVDGVERSLDLLDPEEIESFSILKDATATAVYGVRGANGVILITTRRGKEGKPKISVKAEMGRLEATKIPEMANSVDYAEMYNEMIGYNYYSQEVIDAYRYGTDPDLYPNVNWINAVFKDYAINNRVTASVTGGGSIARYFISGSFYNEGGIFRTDPNSSYNANPNYKRYNFRSNLDVNLSPSTILSLTLGGFLQQQRTPADQASIWKSAFVLSPNTFPIKYSNGYWAGKSEIRNPYYLVTQAGYNKSWKSILNSVISLEQDFSNIITKGLKMNVKFSFDTDSYHNNKYTRQDDIYFASGRDENGALIFDKPEISKGGPWFSQSSSGSNATYLEGSINYNRLFGKHRVGALLLYNQRIYNETASSSIKSLPYKTQGLAGRVTYDFDNRYFIEGNFGYNGSENFASGHRVGFFPSGAIGWYVSNERFFQPLTDVVSKLKLKASIGQVGNDKIGGDVRFIYLGTVTGTGSYVYGTNYTSSSGERVDEVPNPNVSWEVSTKQNYGIELGLFNKIDIQADWFNDTRDHIFVRDNNIPSYVGLSTVPMVNVGKMKSWGFDSSLEYNQMFGDLFVSVRGTFTYASNVILENGDPDNKYPYMNTKGQKIYQNKGFVALGLFESQEEIDRSPIQFSEAMHSTLRPGDIKYQDINGDGMIDDYDIVPIGYSDIPEITYGIGASLGWKGIDFSFFFQGTGRVTCFEQGQTLNPFTSGYADNDGFHKDVVGNYWSESNPDPNARYPRLSNVEYSNNNNTKTSSFWQRDASYIRLKNIEIGYTFPKVWTNKFHVQTLRLFASGINVLTFAKELRLYDPELGTTDGQKYPPTRVFNIGLNINF